MKTPVLLMPIAFEYDPQEKKSLQDSFGITDGQLFQLMNELGRRLRKSKENDDGTDYAQEMMVDLIKEEVISNAMLIYMVCRGLLETWEMFGDGILLMLDAEKESKEKNDAS